MSFQVLAQSAQEPSFSTLSEALGRDGTITVAVLGLVFGFILIVTCIVCVAVSIHVRREQYLKHEERLAMIDAGIHPDYPPKTETDELEKDKTVDYQPRSEKKATSSS